MQGPAPLEPTCLLPPPPPCPTRRSCVLPCRCGAWVLCAGSGVLVPVLPPCMQGAADELDTCAQNEGGGRPCWWRAGCLGCLASAQAVWASGYRAQTPGLTAAHKGLLNAHLRRRLSTWSEAWLTPGAHPPASQCLPGGKGPCCSTWHEQEAGGVAPENPQGGAGV